MKIERAILIAFLGYFLVSNVPPAIAAFVPAGSGLLTVQNLVFVLLAAITVAIMYWWYGKMAAKNLMSGVYFGITGFLVTIVAVLGNGISSVLVQTASFGQLMSVLPNFGGFLWSWQTLILLCYWVIPATLMGWWLGMGKKAPAPQM